MEIGEFPRLSPVFTKETKMRKILGCARVSIDGVMQEDTSDGFDLGGWSMKFSDAKSGAAIMSVVGTLDKPYDLLLGRKTYDIFAGFWPHVPADNPIGPVFTKRSGSRIQSLPRLGGLHH